MTKGKWQPHRRRFLAATGATTAAAVGGRVWPFSGHGPRAGATSTNPVVTENQRPGSTGWYKVFTNQALDGEIEGYASSITVAPGQQLSFHVSTGPAAPYRIEIYRVGHYGGAGARLVTTLPNPSGSYQGTPQPVPAPHPATGLLDLSWPDAATITIPQDWVSGYHLAVFVITEGPHAGRNGVYPFVVSAPASRPPVGLVQAAVTTWQAYNNWPRPSRVGRSLYDFNSTGGSKATHVSFRRPYTVVGNQNVFEWEVHLAQWLERKGYDVAYATGVDTHRDPASLRRYRTVLVAGHDEYWSHEIRSAFDSARDAGVHLGFFGANIGYWQIRFEDQESTIVCYKNAGADPVSDPSRKTVLFRDLVPARPEAALVGVQFQWGMPAGYRDYTVRSDAVGDPWFRDTGFGPGSTVTGVVGYEYDTLVASSPSPITVFFDYGGSPAELLPPGHCTRHVHSSGALVFSTGTMEWPVTMKSDPRLEAFTTNAVDSLFSGSIDPAVPPPVTNRLVTVEPRRLFDSRSGDLIDGPVRAGETVDLPLAEVGGAPAGATAAIVNLTALQASGPGFVTAYPTGEERPPTSSLNTSAGDVVTNLVIVPLGAGGSVSLYANVDVEVVGDLTGWFVPATTTRAGRYEPVAPTRLLDTRSDVPVGRDGSRSVGVTSHPSLPDSGVGAVVITLTAVRSEEPGFVTAYPSGTTRPLVANLIARPGQTRANLAVVAVGHNGGIELYARGRTDLVVDLIGYITDDSMAQTNRGLYVNLAPTRLFDTRVPPDPAALVGPASAVTTTVADGTLVPADAIATVQNVTATAAPAPGFVTIHPAGTDRPLVASLFVPGPGLSRGTTTVVTHGDSGAVSYYAHAGAHLVVDLAGWFTA